MTVRTSGPRPRIGCSGICLGRTPAEAALTAIAAAGFDLVDLAAIRGIAEQVDVFGRPEGQPERLARLVSDLGLEVAAVVSVPWFPDALEDPAELRRRYTLLAEAGAATGAAMLVVDAGNWQRHEDRRTALDRCHRTLDLAAEIATAAGLGLAVEVPHPFTLATTLPDAVEFLAEMDNPGLGVDLDSGHAATCGSPLPDVLAALAGRVVHVALRDVAGPDRHVTPGDGDIDFTRLLATLAGAGYTGPVVVELEPAGDSVPVEQRSREAVRAAEHVREVWPAGPAGGAAAG